MSDAPLRISKQDAMSEHVDNLLARQRNLRGEGGSGSRGKRTWYYQSWFLFGIAGLLGSIIAWAIIEPYLDDNVYIQGEVGGPGAEEGLGWERLPAVRQMGELLPSNLKTYGVIEVAGQYVWLGNHTKIIDASGAIIPYDPELLSDQKILGVHCEYIPMPDFDRSGIALFLVLDPPPENVTTWTIGEGEARSNAAGLLFFPLVAAFIGLCIGAMDGLVCRAFRRAFLVGAVGLLVGFVGGFVATILAGLIYAPLNNLANEQSGDGVGGMTTFGFLTQLVGRGLAWMMAGTAMGLAQGIALRSKRLFLYGLLGGLLGGLFGGLLFDPIDFIILGIDKPSSHWSRIIGLGVIGLSVGAMIGIVELIARDAWLRMTKGPLTGKEFLVFKDLMRIGAAPSSEIYLFNDDQVKKEHAVLRAVGDAIDIEDKAGGRGTLVNGRPVRQTRLSPGDTITIGSTEFVFEQRRQ